MSESPDRPCPASDCRQRFLTARAVGVHLARDHGEERWRERQLITDGGTAVAPAGDAPDPEAVATLKSRLEAVIVCLDEGDYARAEAGLTHALGQTRMHKAREARR
jgi:hypothetical protein